MKSEFGQKKNECIKNLSTKEKKKKTEPKRTLVLISWNASTEIRQTNFCEQTKLRTNMFTTNYYWVKNIYLRRNTSCWLLLHCDKWRTHAGSRHITSFYIRNQRAKHKRMLRDSTDQKFAISKCRFFFSEAAWEYDAIHCAVYCALCTTISDASAVHPKNDWSGYLDRQTTTTTTRNINDEKQRGKKIVRGCRKNVNATDICLHFHVFSMRRAIVVLIIFFLTIRLNFESWRFSNRYDWSLCQKLTINFS